MSNNSRKRSILRKYILPSLLLAAFVVVVVVFVAWNARFTVASGEKSDDFGYDAYRYKIEENFFRTGFRLTITSTRGMEFIYDSGGGLTVEEIVEQRWLKNDAAIYLNLRIKHQSSIPTEAGPARIIYDFHRGEIYVSSGYTLWRNFDRTHDSKDWMSEAEFDAVLIRLEQAVQQSSNEYPATWFAAINDPTKPDWEILPQEEAAGEVVLSKRNERSPIAVAFRQRMGTSILF